VTKVDQRMALHKKRKTISKLDWETAPPNLRLDEYECEEDLNNCDGTSVRSEDFPVTFPEECTHEFVERFAKANSRQCLVDLVARAEAKLKYLDQRLKNFKMTAKAELKVVGDKLRGLGLED
jgi:hypothetical protein